MKISALEYLLNTAAKMPDRIAISEPGHNITFAELVAKGGSVASLIGTDALRKPVVVYLPKSHLALISFVGILSSGAFYVPVDVNAPIERKKTIIDILQPHKVISTRRYEKELRKLVVAEIIWIEECADRVSQVVVPDGVIDCDPCYVMFTSGSTGIPKGVVVPHRGVIDYIDWSVDILRPNESHVIGSQAPLFFDNSTLDIYLSWARGSCLHLIPEKAFVLPGDLTSYLAKNKINWIFFVPSVLNNVARVNALQNVDLRMDMIAFAGEVMPSKTLSYWQKHVPGARFVNLYGPTEITVDCTWFEVDRVYADDEEVPIGFPCRNTDILIVNEDGQPCEAGEIGELLVRGSSLALGYFGDKAKTNSAFKQNPTHEFYVDPVYRTGDLALRRKDGAIMYVGRRDNQIKHRGYRIELGDIESAANSADDVGACVALYDSENTEICLVVEADDEFDPDTLRRLLRDKLPAYMIPRSIKKTKKLPLTSTGKADRARLREIYINGRIDVRGGIEDLIRSRASDDLDLTSSDLIEDGILDSFDVVILISELEERFSIKISGEDAVLGNFRSLSSIEDLLLRRMEY